MSRVTMQLTDDRGPKTFGIRKYRCAGHVLVDTTFIRACASCLSLSLSLSLSLLRGEARRDNVAAATMRRRERQGREREEERE